MKVIAARSSGFCFGVKNAVNSAYKMIEERSEGERLVMLGELTHNEGVVKGLTDKGFEVCSCAAEVPEGSTVIIRAHGVTPGEKAILGAKGCKVVDCTCPFVEKIHKIVRSEAEAGHNIILTGGKGHPEVVGICGEAPENVTVISSVEELKNVEITENKTSLISQTTFSSVIFEEICANIKNKIANNLIFDTICNTTDIRQSEAARISASSDVMLVIGSSRSSNTNKLYDICLSQCDRTYLVSDVNEVDSLIAEGKIKEEDTVGVTAGASTPEAIILEVVRRMDENKETMIDQEAADTNFAEYIESIPQLRRNSIVKGAITSADDDYVYVDVRDKSEGKISRKEFASDPEFDIEKAIADRMEVTVVVKSIRNTDQGKEIILSKSQLDYEKNKKLIEEAYESKTPVKATVTGVVKDGVIANYGGIDIYVHRTQIKIGDVADLESYKGEQLDLLITKVDTEKHRLRVSGSHRAILSAERKAKSDEIWNNIEEGKHYTGIVRSLPDFGAFVDIGGVDGLVHITELSWKRIRKPSDVLSVGDEIDVYVKSFNAETKKISLGYKKLEDDPYYNIEERIPVGSCVKGTVVRLTDFGAFVQLEPDLDALCHVSQISDVRLNKPADVLSVGQEVLAKVIDIKPEQRRISISIKEVQPINPASDDDFAIADEEAPAEE
ncbi:MAG: bifunctional 4-hydroxy-3-methylbut-2-enyl diphosphate reductase/30S ribosomal protein S1 [Saccharofermentans sp.]|nr:bifunctional 4-hydroxy-3-methylbut-2-enyl diphosphate reductase/30S ribosomal protein S1 [Saccharofermentans sp.]